MVEQHEEQEMSGSDENDGGKHGGARQMADAATHAQADGRDGQAADMIDQAMRTDPEGLANALAQEEGAPPLPGDADVTDDDEVAAISRTIKPHADAPSRAGITGSGSGADDM
jgi:hypothetical protein